MKETTPGSRNGIQWSLVDQLEHLYSWLILTRLQAKTTKLEAVSPTLGLKINTDKTKTIRINSSTRKQITIYELGIELRCNILYILGQRYQYHGRKR